MSALEVIRDALRDHGSLIRETGDTFAAQCPAHPDANPSLSVATRTDGKGVILFCHAGCEYQEILRALGLHPRDLFDDTTMREIYGDTRDYNYPGGRVVHRGPDKTFWQRGNKKDPSLFQSELIGDATTVFVTEGERDAEAIAAIGGAAVSPPMGAGKTRLDRYDWTPLAGRHVIIIADRDGPGFTHADQLFELLKPIAATVAVLAAKAGKDPADHVAAGFGLEEFQGDTIAATPTVERNDTPKLWRAVDLKPAGQQHWLAKGRVVSSAINLLIGDEGIGKSLLWVWIAAAVTTGKPVAAFGIPARDPGHVIVAVTEDDWSTTVRPRLEVAGADLTMIRVICIENDGSGAPTFPADLHLIVAADPAPVLVVVDAWLDTVPAALNVQKPQQARQALHPWREVATITGAAVLLLCHTNRVASANARDKYGATGELRKKARMTLYAQADDDGRLIVGPEKSNTAAVVPASTFSIHAVQHFDPSDDDDGTVPELVYAGDSDRTAREHIAAAFDSDRGDDPQDRSDAERWLSEYLQEEGPRAQSATAKREAFKAGLTEKTLRRARVKLGVVITYEGMPAKSVWSLPDQATDNGAVVPDGSVSLTERAQQDDLGSSSQVNAGMPCYAPGHDRGHDRAHQQLPAEAEIRAPSPVVPVVPFPCDECGAQLIAPESIERGRCTECVVFGADPLAANPSTNGVTQP